MAMYKDIALAVEGGGMRGAYSAGVLDVFLDNGIKFGACAGTSAGATHLCSYLSEQRERNKRLDTIHSASKRYMSWGNLIRTGDFFELDYCYNEIPRVIDKGRCMFCRRGGPERRDPPCIPGRKACRRGRQAGIQENFRELVHPL